MHPLDHLNPTELHKKHFDRLKLTTQDIPKCICGQDVCLDKSYPNRLFRTYCSNTCSKIYSKIPPESIPRLTDYNWMYEQRITYKKSKEQIAAELGVSITPVNKWLDKLGIPDVRYNESEIKIQNVIKNKNQLESLYAEGFTIAEIASKIGSSSATVQRFMQLHGITMRGSNSYDRDIKVSGEELQLVEWIKSKYVGLVQQGNRSILNGRELDIIIPEKQFAIEYNGLYSHLFRPDETHPSRVKGREYHLAKTEDCAKVGYQLIHIFSDQWKHRRTAVENMLQSKLGLNKRVAARKCEVRELDTSEKRQFINLYHLQGDSQSKINLGLYLADELQAVMTFSTPRFTKNYQWELARFCCKQGITIVGGFSKLLTWFRKRYPGSIVSYADRSYSNGNVYQQNGFKLVKINKPSYFYVNLNTETRALRTTFTKAALSKKLEIPDTILTEQEITELLQLPKIWDCGTLTYVLEPGH